MADDDLAQIRAARLAQLKAQGGGGGGGGGGAGGQGNEDEERKRQQESEARSSILAQILEPDAADRLGRIRMVNGQRATEVENRLIMLAQSGQVRQKVTEEQLKQLLASLAEHERETGKAGGGELKVVRRKGWVEDDNDLDELLERQ